MVEFISARDIHPTTTVKQLFQQSLLEQLFPQSLLEQLFPQSLVEQLFQQPFQRPTFGNLVSCNAINVFQVLDTQILPQGLRNTLTRTWAAALKLKICQILIFRLFCYTLVRLWI